MFALLGCAGLRRRLGSGGDLDFEQVPAAIPGIGPWAARGEAEPSSMADRGHLAGSWGRSEAERLTSDPSPPLQIQQVFNWVII